MWEQTSDLNVVGVAQHGEHLIPVIFIHTGTVQCGVHLDRYAHSAGVAKGGVDKHTGMLWGDHRKVSTFEKEYFAKELALPIFEDKHKITVMTTVDYNLDNVKAKLNKPLEIVYCTEEILKQSLDPTDKSNYVEINLYIIEQLVKEKLITTMQGIIAINYTCERDSIEETLKKMGLLRNIEH